jgi:phosphate-selective porin OprO/OprP
MNNHWKRFAALSLAGLAFAAAAVYGDGDTASTVDALRAQIEELDQKLRILERKQEIADEFTSGEFKKIPDIRADSGGLRVTSKDKKFDFRLRGLLQVDYRTYLDTDLNTSVAATNNPDQNDGFVLRRVRPRFQGTLWENTTFEFTPELSWGNNANTVRITDTWANHKFYDEFNIKAGLFKTPLGIERLQSAASTPFPEHGLATNLVPTRDIGAEINGLTWNKKLSYRLGVFQGVVDSDDSRTNTSLQEGVDVIAGVFVEPFKKNGPLELQGLGFGVAGSWGEKQGTFQNGNRLRYRSAGQDAFFDTNTANFNLAGDAYRLNPSLYYYYGPWGLIGEYVYSSYGFERANNTNLGGRVASQAWSATATYVLTGEDASYAGVKPDRPFSMKEGGWGAWEIGGRIGSVSIDGDAFNVIGGQRLAVNGSAEEALGYGAVVNWYLNQNVKAQLAYDHTEYNGYAGGSGDRPDEDVIVDRFQVAL